MSRTYGGYLFRCKVCGKLHLLNSKELHNKMRVPCAEDEDMVKKYKKNNFEFWMGDYQSVSGIIVKEVKNSSL